MADITFEHMYKIYDGGIEAVSDFNLTVNNEEFIVFVGPSGCGKSTTLRMIAGLEDITKGDLIIDGLKVNDVAPKDRDIAMVFQNYALYPHMSVYDNMAFSLKIRKLPKREIKETIHKAATILGIEELLSRKPKALSGGQRQRVALGRAIVRDPKVFLMDEPLSNLDAKLRLKMRAEIKKLHNQLNATTIYVTHDQTEAMSMADRIVIMEGGVIQQVGTPKEVYNFPRNLFVGSFIGSPAMNFIKGYLTEDAFQVDTTIIKLSQGKMKELHDKGYAGKDIILGVRPEDFILQETQMDESLSIRVNILELLGSDQMIHTTIENQEIIITVAADYSIAQADVLNFTLNENKIHFFDSVTSERIK